jgi:aminoglycoside phosphotransferase (APT) family kinase protein
MVAGEVDPMAILEALGIAAPERVAPIAGGWDTLLWRVDAADGSRYALRVFRGEQAATCRREALVMRALAEQGLPVPLVHAESPDADRPALLLQWCDGQPLLRAVATQPWRAWPLGRAMGHLQARLHSVQPAQTLIDQLPRIEIGDDPPAVLHMDFHPLNVMVNRQGISGILDWANVGFGDPRADLARTVTILRLAPAPPNASGLPLPPLRALLELAWRSGYTHQRRDDAFRGMDPFYAWAGDWMERDLRPKLGKPGVWLQPSDLARISSWTLAHRHRGNP